MSSVQLPHHLTSAFDLVSDAVLARLDGPKGDGKDADGNPRRTPTGGLAGPLNAFLLSPELGLALSSWNRNILSLPISITAPGVDA